MHDKDSEKFEESMTPKKFVKLLGLKPKPVDYILTPKMLYLTKNICILNEIKD